MMGLRDFGLEVIINGGDTFLDAYCEKYSSWEDIITGINQETVFSKICWEDGSFGRATEELISQYDTEAISDDPGPADI